MAFESITGLMNQLFKTKTIIIFINIVNASSQIKYLMIKTKESFFQFTLSIRLNQRPTFNIF